MPYAIITGATKGIGKAIAEKLLTEGFHVGICSRNKNDLDLLEKDWNEKYPTASIIAQTADFINKDEVISFADAVLSVFPSIDILVNNAGIFLQGQLAEEPEGQLETLMAINMYSAYHLTRQILPFMKKEQMGHIFNICSVASLKAYPNGGSYGIAKYALLGFSENLREELRSHNIKVTALCPGATYSHSWSDSGIEPERMMEASDVANILWASYALSAQADVETIIMRPIKGDL